MTKPVIACLGNCQSGAIRGVLLAIPEVKERFDVLFTRRPQEFAAMRERIAVVVQQATHSWDDFTVGDLPTGATHIRYPAALMNYPWPLIPFQRRVKERTAREAHFPYTICDALVDELRAKGVPKECLLDAYFSVDVTKRFPLERLRRINEAKARQIDALSDFPIWDQMQVGQSMRTANHPNGPLLSCMVAQIIERLPLADVAAAQEEAAARVTDYGIQPVEAPVHPQVADALGLEWAKDRKWTFWLEGDFTFEERLLRLYDMSYNEAFQEGRDKLAKGEDAVLSFEQASRELPDSPMVHTFYATALIKAGRWSEAADVRGRIWKLDPSDTNRTRYWAALRRAKRMDEADAILAANDGSPSQTETIAPAS